MSPVFPPLPPHLVAEFDQRIAMLDDALARCHAIVADHMRECPSLPCAVGGTILMLCEEFGTADGRITPAVELLARMIVRDVQAELDEEE